MPSPRQKIILIGSGGAGKSTLARALGEVLHLPVHHLDVLHWRAGWVSPTKEDWIATQKKICVGESWIIDGNYGGTMDLRLAAADTIIFVDLPRWLCLYRALKRALVFRGLTRPDMAAGCPERIDAEFVQWIWNYPATRRPGILEKLERLRGRKEIIILKTKRELSAFLITIGRDATPISPDSPGRYGFQGLGN